MSSFEGLGSPPWRVFGASDADAALIDTVCDEAWASTPPA